ncbi:glycosyltransferase [Sphingomonas sp. 28-63-12]|uniref:glycosyltransferase n=1 Tax=Sphingomonas sp. 28-63-12 TaxID=1970434 RepID=UPI000BC9B305|nr:MAG: polysaccharide deacetylase [Sphingomonas sp. 28-63-12]
MNRPIFFDPSGNRRRWTSRTLGLVLAAIILAAAAFAFTLVRVPAQASLPLSFERAQPARLRTQISAIRHGFRRATAWLPRARTGKPATPLTIGFYVPWDEDSASSLNAHIDVLDWVVPATIEVTGPVHALHAVPDARLARILQSAAHHPAVLPMVQNADNGVWDSAGATALFADPVARARLVKGLAAMVAHDHNAGLVFDFETLPASALPGYRQLIREVRAALVPLHAIVAVTVPAGDPDWSPRAFGAVADRIILMNYDFHWQGGESGPIAPQPWFVDQLRQAVGALGRDRVIVAVGNYAYDWHSGKADAMTIEEAWLAAHDSKAKIVFDPASGNAGFGYEDDDGHHDVWMLDAASGWNQLRAAQALGVQAVALWRLGSEDPGIWAALAHFRVGQRPDLTQLHQASNVDVEGNGEILRITATPQSGSRTVTFDKQGLVRGEVYHQLPTPYVVNRTGARDKMIALTFDDGPDPDWTPPILAILKRLHVPGTFFVIGENALGNPGLLMQMAQNGNEIGNHTYTHPNLALDSATGTKIELNATQRLIEAYTGASTRLFRAPYFGDAEPTTADEIDPALIAQRRGYTVVGLHADPGDWRRPGVDAIVNRTINAVENGDAERSANIVLLHDGGGDRAQTVAALPRIIAELRARGYRFVPVSTLAGLSRAAVMPPVTGSDLVAVRVDVGIFLVLAAIGWLLKWLFFLAIGLGIARAILIAALALADRRGAPPEQGDVPLTVSVVIPAYNEARVIEDSVRRVLASDYPGIELIVADDGSSDATSAIVTAAFGDDPRVTLLTLVNGGKATALNRALAEARGEIIIALDADTQFEPETISRLARWFVDPAIGAVAGNAKVGNRVNLVTRWQAIEYVTAQNLERRALARFDAMTVVPGAVGAWRRTALDDVGGYPEDTLAEDQDLTIAIQRAGWRIEYDTDAIAWTEAPQTFSALARQRYRWAFGTLQCLWKHRAVIRRRTPAGLALVGMPQAWLFQIFFAAISPVIDLALVTSIVATIVRVIQHGYAQTQTDLIRMALYWIGFVTIDLICGWIAYRLDTRERRYPGLLLIAQRFIYRQIMYWVVLRAISSALGGWFVGWGKLERTGTVNQAGPTPVA